MDLHPLHHFNYWAILVSALIIWMLGAAWYSPALFAKPWMADLNILPTGPRTAASKGLALGMVSSLLGDLLLAFLLTHFIHWSGATSFPTGAFVGLISWLAFFAAIQLPQGIYEGRPARLFLINGGYWLLSLLLIGGLLAVWR